MDVLVSCIDMYYISDRSIMYHKSSSIWKGIKEGLQLMAQDTQVVFGQKSNSKIWYDNWYGGGRLIDAVEIPVELEYTRNLNIAEFIEAGSWKIHEEFENKLPDIAAEMKNMEIEEEDQLYWTGSSNGVLTTKEAFNHYHDKAPTVHWMKSIWQHYIPPKISVHMWRIVMNRLPTAQHLSKRGMNISSVCLGCIYGETETRDHLFWSCTNARNLWNWISAATSINFNSFGSVNEACRWDFKLNNKTQFNQLLKVLVSCTC